MIPQIESVSCVIDSIWSRFSRVFLRMSYMRRPTGPSGRTISGTMTIESSASRQFQTNIATSVVAMTTTLVTIERERSRHDVVDVVDVVADAVHDLAGLRSGEERERHPVQMRDQARADVAHDAFADDRVEIALQRRRPAPRQQRRSEDDADVDAELAQDCGAESRRR